jgi:hypothetical protein
MVVELSFYTKWLGRSGVFVNDDVKAAHDKNGHPGSDSLTLLCHAYRTLLTVTLDEDK